MAANNKKGTGPYSQYNPDGTKKTPEQYRKAVALATKKKYHRKKKTGTGLPTAQELNGDSDNAIVGGKLRWTLIARTGPHLYRIFITGVGEFVAKKASIRI